MLQDALFPAKMLLSTIISKLLLYMNKSGNKTIAYVRKGNQKVGPLVFSNEYEALG